jgi:hypothetical protein|tara:strand:+ start:1607 stop:2539 length:933 start_codon:yes stop_codon:yes gene_type:complete
MKKPQILKEIINKELPEVNYAYQKSISYSQMSTYRSCPHKWSLQYKDGHRNNDPNIYFTFGTSMHEIIQDWLTTLYEESATKADEMDLEELFRENFINLYKKEYKKFNNTHYSSPEQLREFFEDGVAILDFIKKKRSTYFSKRGWHLAGIELPIVMNVGTNLLYKGYIDMVLYHEPTNKFYIYDIKTSTSGWGNKAKRDEAKQMQLVLYKKFFNEQHGIPLENIEVEFFIVRRKVWENSEYPIHRVQLHKPAAGRNKLSKADKMIKEFIDECFTPKGKYQEKEHNKIVSSMCKWCAFNDNKELCNKNTSS